MTVNKANKKIKKTKNNNYLISVIEAFVLTAAAVFLSVISGVFFADLIGFGCIVAASALISCALFLTGASVILISGIASFAISFVLIDGDIISALASLIYIVIAAFIYFGVKTKKNRTQITLGATVFLTVFYIALIILSFLLETGTFSIGMVSSMIDSELTKSAELFVNQYNSLVTQSQSAGATSEAGQAIQTIVSAEDYIKELVMNLKAIIPACFIICNIIIAYLSTSLFKAAYNIFIPMANPSRKRIKNKYWRINISAVSAVIMIVAIFLSVIVSKEDNILTAIVLTNLVYILAPGFCLMGIYFVFDKLFNSRPGILPVALVIGSVMLAFIFPFALTFILYSMASVLMALGLYSALIDDIKKFFDKAKKALLGNNDDDDDNDDYID